MASTTGVGRTLLARSVRPLQYSTPGLDDDSLQKFSQEHACTDKFISILNQMSMKFHSKLGDLLN